MLDGVPLNIFCMKEPEYVMKIMATYSGLTELEGQKESVRRYTGLDGSEKITKFIRYYHIYVTFSGFSVFSEKGAKLGPNVSYSYTRVLNSTSRNS